MTARSTFEATVKTAAVTKTVSLTNNEMVRQTAIDAQRSVVGLVLQNGNSAFVTAVKNANQAKWDADYAAEQAKQAAIAVARDTLRATNDLGPA